MKAKTYTIGNETGTLYYFALKYGISTYTLKYRIEKGFPADEILKPTEQGFVINGERGSLNYFSQKYGISRSTILYRIRAGFRPEDILRQEHAPMRWSRWNVPEEKPGPTDCKAERTPEQVRAEYEFCKTPAPYRPPVPEGPHLRELFAKNAGKKVVFIRTSANSGFFWWSDGEEKE